MNEGGAFIPTVREELAETGKNEIRHRLIVQQNKHEFSFQQNQKALKEFA